MRMSVTGSCRTSGTECLGRVGMVFLEGRRMLLGEGSHRVAVGKQHPLRVRDGMRWLQVPWWAARCTRAMASALDQSLRQAWTLELPLGKNKFKPKHGEESGGVTDRRDAQ